MSVFHASKDVGQILPDRKAMRDHEQEFGTTDIGLMLFVVVAGWVLIFYSGVFG